VVVGRTYPVSRTSGENIGDSGIIQAYRAWKAQFDDSLKAGNEYLLPGLNFTRYDIANHLDIRQLSQSRRDQLFFMSFGRIWAENIKPEALVQRVRTDPHSPNQFRVDGTLYNVPEFATAFNCSSKAKVRCSVHPIVMYSHEHSSLTLPRRNDAFSGRDRWSSEGYE
jgi:endothelin-converting enzyme